MDLSGDWVASLHTQLLSGADPAILWVDRRGVSVLVAPFLPSKASVYGCAMREVDYTGKTPELPLLPLRTT